MLNYANLHEDRGERAEAAALYERVLVADPMCFLAIARHAGLQPRAACDATLGFALGRVPLDAAGGYTAAYRACAAANRDSRASAAPLYVRYGRAAQAAMTERLIATPLPPPVPTPADARPRPVFIVGIFRSGSTLTEHLLAGHSGVAGGGELDRLLTATAIATQVMPFPAAARPPSVRVRPASGRSRSSMTRPARDAVLVAEAAASGGLGFAPRPQRRVSTDCRAARHGHQNVLSGIPSIERMLGRP